MSDNAENLPAQIAAARELAAQAQAGAMADPMWSVVAAEGEAAIAVHVLDNALRHLLWVQLAPLLEDDRLDALQATMIVLGQHIGRLGLTLPPDDLPRALKAAVGAAVHGAGARAQISTAYETQPKEAVH